MQKFSTGNYEVVSNVVNTNYFCFKPVNTNTPFTVMHASMLTPEKNTFIIIEAIAAIIKKKQEVYLDLYTPITEELTQKINELQIASYINLKGLQPHTAMPTAMQFAHVQVLYSHMETQGCTVIESLCCGRPVITGTAPVFTEMIDATNGIICSAIDVTTLANAIIYLKENYANYNLENIATNAHNKYSYAAIAKAFSVLYFKILK